MKIALRKLRLTPLALSSARKLFKLVTRGASFKIWDTAGQDRYRAVTRAYYRGAMAAILVYDVTCRESYNHLPNWLSDVTEQGNPNMFVIAVGNKKDLVVDRQVSYLEASVFCQENNILLIECSALTGEGVSLFGPF